MSRTKIAFFAAGLAGAVLAAGALADGGGPSPGAVQGAAGVVAPSGAVRYVALPAGPRTAVAAVRVRGGEVLRSGALRGDWGVPVVTWDGTTGGVSADGRTLVLGEPSSGLQAASRFAVLDTKSLRLRKVVVLRGAFSFDALSPDAATLYLIEHISQPDYSRYRVRAYDLAAGRLLRRAIADKRESETTMSGQPITRATNVDGGWVYTLYRNDGGVPFVHALDTRNRVAVCIDLPWRGSQDALWKLRMGLADDGRRLELRRRGGGLVTLVDTRTFRARGI